MGKGAAVPVEGEHHVGADGAVILHAGDAELDDMADLPEAGALVHVLVEPLVSDGEVELLDQVRQLGVEGPEERDDPLEELERHEAVRCEGPLELVEPAGQVRVEATDGRIVHVDGSGRRRGSPSGKASPRTEEKGEEGPVGAGGIEVGRRREREGGGGEGGKWLKSPVSYVEKDSWQQ